MSSGTFYAAQALKFNYERNRMENGRIGALNHEVNKANAWKQWAEQEMATQQDKIHSLEKELSNWRSKYATAMTDSKVMRSATQQLAKATGAYIKNFREMTGLSSKTLDEKTDNFINELLELKRTNFNNATTADEVTKYLDHVVERIPELRGDITDAIEVGFNNSAAIALNEKEYIRLMQSQKAYEETANLYRSLTTEYKEVINKANENIKQYNELVERYKNLKSGAQDYHKETKQILEQLDSENKKLRDDKSLLEQKVKGFIEQKESFFLNFDDSVKVFSEMVILKLTEHEYEKSIDGNIPFKGVVRDSLFKGAISDHVRSYLTEFEASDVEEDIYDLYQSLDDFKAQVDMEYLTRNGYDEA